MVARRPGVVVSRWVVLLVFALVCAFPFGWATFTMFKADVEPKWEGHGVGSALVQGALEDIRARGLKVRPLCPFVAAYIERHPEYGDLVQR